jgi:hypothetical protein
MSKTWASLGEEYLLAPEFTSLPHRDDMKRLLAISNHPKYSYRIQAVSVVLAEANEYHARHNMFSRTYTLLDRAKLNEEAWKAYREHQVLKEKYLPGCCEPNLLKNILLRLPNLRSIRVSLTECPFQDPNLYPDTLRQIWATPSTRLLPRVATTERFTNILTAIVSASSVCNIQTLSHDRLPFSFFAQKHLQISFVAIAFQPLTSLSLTIDYTDLPSNLHPVPLFDNLSYCLRLAPKLRTLYLAFRGQKKISISSLLTSLQLNSFRYTELEDLTLEGIAATEKELGLFLTEQKMLKRLRLGGDGVHTWHERPNGGVHLTTGSFRDLFAKVKADLTLEKFELMGDCKGEESGEEWLLEAADDIKNLREYVLD